MVLIDAIVRLLPGVIGSQDSLVSESHENGLLEYPQYTKPRSFEGADIPDVLLSGDHGKIARWRKPAGRAGHAAATPRHVAKPARQTTVKHRLIIWVKSKNVSYWKPCGCRAFNRLILNAVLAQYLPPAPATGRIILLVGWQGGGGHDEGCGPYHYLRRIDKARICGVAVTKARRAVSPVSHDPDRGGTSGS